MKILLDTNILLWALYSPDILKTNNKELIEDVSNEIYVSAVSLWEISVNVSAKKLEIPKFDIDKLLNAINESGFELLDLSSVDALTSFKLPRLKNKDPFDRMLIWQSIQNNCNLMSADSNLGEYKKYGLKSI